mmetsp:Transcript_17416/g.44591  ORF Transcript_17416/g.44591 Transcript_17416/m.44591 type:complete len:239 (+) Transcript_17416:172-888(+)
MHIERSQWRYAGSTLILYAMYEYATLEARNTLRYCTYEGQHGNWLRHSTECKMATSSVSCFVASRHDIRNTIHEWKPEDRRKRRRKRSATFHSHRDTDSRSPRQWRRPPRLFDVHWPFSRSSRESCIMLCSAEDTSHPSFVWCHASSLWLHDTIRALLFAPCGRAAHTRPHKPEALSIYCVFSPVALGKPVRIPVLDTAATPAITKLMRKTGELMASAPAAKPAPIAKKMPRTRTRTV